MLHLVVADAVEHIAVAGRCDPAELVDQRAGGLGQIEALDPPVGRIGAPLDQTGRLHAVDLARERDRLHIHGVGQRRLVQWLFAMHLGARNSGKNAPLGARQADGLGLMIDAAAQETTDVVDQEPDALGRWHMLVLHVADIISGLIICKLAILSQRHR